jgi:hypothetical protein
MWAANQANQGLGQITGTLGEAENRAGGYLTEAYDAGGEALGAGYADALTALSSGYGGAGLPLTQGQDNARNWLTGSRDQAMAALEMGRTAGLGTLYQGLDNATNWLTGSRDTAQGYLNQGQTNLRDQFGQGIATLGGAAGLYDPLISRGMAGYDMLSNSLGINGPAGNAAAVSAFQAGPGYQWQVDQASDAAQRAANRTGQLYGGNTVDAVTRLGSNLANQEYGAWQNRLAPYQGATLAATSGKANTLGQMAGMYGQLGTGLAGLDTASAALQQRSGQDIAGANMSTAQNASNLWRGTAQDMSTLQRGTGQDLANLDMRTAAALSGLEVQEGQDYANLSNTYADRLAQLAGGYGSGMAGLATGTAGTIAQAQQAANNTITQAGTQGLLAGQQAAGNTWGAILGAAGLGTKLLGSGSGGFGSLIGTLFK